MYNTQEYINLIGERLSQHRFYHSMCVAQAAEKLAAKYGFDTEKAYVAGLLHDVTKETSPAQQLELISRAGMNMTPLELNSKKLYHQMSGAAFVKLELGISDDNIVSSIRYHTTGKANMTLAQQIIFLADFISDDRDYDDVDIMRQKVNEGRIAGIIYSTEYTINDLKRKGKPIHPDTIAAFEWAQKLNKKSDKSL